MKSIETLDDVATDPESPAGIAARWIAEIGQSKKYQKTYVERCGKILDRYKDKRANITGANKRKFSVLWSNIETLKPACYAKLPAPYVKRTFNDDDPLARVSSEVLERCLKNNLENYDFDGVLKSVRDDFLLFARGVPWVRYEADIAPLPTEPGATEAANEGEQPIANEQVTGERTVCDHVCLEDFGTNTARTWAEVRFGWRRVYMTRDALKKRFTNKVSEGSEQIIGAIIPLDWKPEDSRTDDDQRTEMFAKAMVYEIWDKDSRKVYWISEAYPNSPLDMRDDPLGLKDFFPFPKPAFGTIGNDAVIPVPDYIFYQDQAEEVDELTLRIGLLTQALRVVGLYAGDEKASLQQLFKQSAENAMIPVDTWAAFQDKGGIKGVVEWLPVDMVVGVLTGLFETRAKLMEDIYQITGISDIMRGQTEASETATAQQLKSNFGSARVREKQKELARVARDVMRIEAEIISEKFGVDTLEAQSGFKLLRQAEKQMVMQWQQAMQMLQAQQQQAMQAQAGPQQPGQPPMQAPPMPQMQPPPPPLPEDKMKLMNLPTWEEVKEFLANQARRMFRIEVEADSTVDADIQAQQVAATQYVTSMGGLIAQALPAVQAAPALGGFLGEVIKAVGRLYPFGRQFEEIIDRTMEEIGKQPPTPPEGQEKPAQKGKSPEELAIEAQKVQLGQAQLQQDAQTAVMEAQTAQVQSRDKKEIELAKLDSNERIARLEAQLQQMSAMMEASTRHRESGEEAGTRRYEADTDYDIRQFEAEQARQAEAAEPNGAY